MGSINYHLEFFVGPISKSGGNDGRVLLDVRRVEFQEDCSRPFQLEVTADFDGRLPVRSFLHSQATLEVQEVTDTSSTTVRYVQGVVSRVKERLVRSDKASQRITFTVEPPVVWLRLTRDSRIFLKKTTQEIVLEIFASCGLPTEELEFRLAETYLPREVCTQYEETSFDFISRLLEEEGICYYFEHRESGLKMVFVDSPVKFSQHFRGSLPLIPGAGNATGEAVLRVSPFKKLRPAKVVLRDHDYRKSDVLLEAIAEDDAQFGIEYYEYPGRFTEDSVGKRYAKSRLGELTALAEGLNGTAQAFSLTPGHLFKLTEADELLLAVDSSQKNPEKWLPVHVYHHWAGFESGKTSCETRFSARRGDHAYYPERRTPMAWAKGPMLAMVTTGGGEEIDCDEFGCVTVQFVWDRHGKNDNQSSGPVRVLQMQSSGSVAIPRKGWEVVVECEHGDPDRPIIVGRLYNSVLAPPASLPAEKTVTAFQSFTSPGGGGHNEIRITDGAGGELVQVHAQKDMNVVVANDRKIHVTNNATVGIGANQQLAVGVARTEDVGANDELVVGGNQSWTVGAVRTETVTKDLKFDFKGNRDATIGVSHMTMSPQTIAISTQGNFTETVGGLCLEASALETSMAVGGSYKATVGGAKIEAVAAGKTEMTVGARSVMVGGAFINASGKDVAFTSKGKKSTTVGGVMLSAGGENAEISAKTDLKIKIGAALAVTGATVILKVGDSNITLSGGSAVVSAKEIMLEATGPNAELAPMVSSK